jgi:SAM-dependent methyltransferase
MLRRIVNRILRPFQLKVVPVRHDLLLYQHDYGAGGYEAYRAAQIHWNKAKLEKVWADDRTLEAIAVNLERRGLRTGICHGARNGFEVSWFRKRLGTPVIGTDISDTAPQFPDMVIHDFHERRDDWVGKFDFVYSNSLDQAFDPQKALAAWSEQLRGGGCIYLEHTMQHGPEGASEMDPFGAHPMTIPYLLFKWGTGKYRLAEILEPGEVVGKGKVWVFVIEREGFVEAGEPSASSDRSLARPVV